mmetsp:Transcript_22634/g.52542  ORF Transcript_22634/g.52542 Transcript_22634/m.52542 type:complete len:327 (-) Transcript_22634:356-1336(-)
MHCQLTQAIFSPILSSDNVVGEHCLKHSSNVLGEHLPHTPAHKRNLCPRESNRRWDVEASLRHFDSVGLGHRHPVCAVELVVDVWRHSMDRVEEGSRLDAKILQVCTDVIPQGSTTPFREPHTGKPWARLTPPVPNVDPHTFEPLQCSSIRLYHPLTSVKELSETLQLSYPNSAKQVAKPVVETDFCVPEATVGRHGVTSQVDHPLVKLLALRDDNAPLPCAHNLVRVKAKRGHVPERSRGLPLVQRPVRLRRVLDHGDPMLFRYGQQGVHVGNVSVQVNHDDALGACCNRLLHRPWADQPQLVAVSKHRDPPCINHCGSGCNVCH